MRRTAHQIENDFNRIQKLIKINSESISSLAEIANALNLSVSQVETSLKNHPVVYKRLKKLMAENRGWCRKATEKPKIAETPEKIEEDSIFSRIVIDASISGNPGIVDKLNSLINDGKKIVLTSVTIRELEQMQRFSDVDAKDARKILAMAAKNKDDFICESIREDNLIADDNIIQYAREHKSEVILMTSDKTMDLKSRSFGVQTMYIEHSAVHHKKHGHGMHGNWGKVSTLYDAKFQNGKLVISDFYTDFKNLRVLRNGIEFNDGKVELQLGDDIYIGTKKDRILTFAHYHLTSLGSKNNCRLVFSRRVFNSREIDRLPQPTYRTFMLDFKRRFDSWKF